MSTKIYDGLIAVDMNPFRVHARMRAVLEPLFLAKYDAAVEQAHEGAATGETWPDVFPLLRRERYARWSGAIPETGVHKEVYDLIVALQADPAHTFNDLDFGYNAVLLPNGRGLTEPPLVLVFSEAAGVEYRTALMGAGVVAEYGYWNNTDEPEGMTAAGWAERKTAWDLLDVPSRDGLNITMPNAFDAEWNGRG